MSNKQAVLYTLMILFLATMLITLGMWFHYSVELDTRVKQISLKNDQLIELGYVLNGPPSNPDAGIKNQVDDPQRGLDKQLQDAVAAVAAMKTSSDPNSPGLEERIKQYMDQEAELKKAWVDTASPAWKQFYDEWKKQNEDIAAALERLKKQKTESEEKEKTASDELAAELSNEEVERKKIAQELNKMSAELTQVRLEHEETSIKVTEVSREYSKEKKVSPQGKIVMSDPRLKTATIDIGANQGVRKGMQFTIYSEMHRNHVKKGLLEVVDAGPSTSQCVLLAFVRDLRMDPITGYVPKSPNEKYSPFAAGGPEETDALELVKPKTKADRVEALRLDKIAKEQGLEAAQNARADSPASASPPNELSPALNPVLPGDWIFNPDFVAVVSTAEFHAQTRNELISMKNVNVGPLTFHIADTVKFYRKEYLKRLCERNGCKVSDGMTADVNFLVVGAGFTRMDLLEEKLASSKAKEDVKEDVKVQRATLAALQEAKKAGADVLPEDQMEVFFDQRNRKQELLRGKAIQPGRQVFFIAGRTRDRSVEQLGHYIRQHGGIMGTSIDDKVDYVVVGERPDDALVEGIKKRGLKIIREDELPELFGDKQ